jgi:hypothetical protein
VLALAQKIIFVSKSYGLSLTKSYQSFEDFIANLFKRFKICFFVHFFNTKVVDFIVARDFPIRYFINNIIQFISYIFYPDSFNPKITVY